MSTGTATENESPRPASRSWRSRGPLISLAAGVILSTGMSWAGATSGLTWWSWPYLFVITTASIEGWRLLRKRLGSWTALAGLSLIWAALSGVAAVSGVLCDGSCPTSEVASYTLAGALTPWLAVLFSLPLIAATWAGRGLFTRLKRHMSTNDKPQAERAKVKQAGSPKSAKAAPRYVASRKDRLRSGSAVRSRAAK